jgi:hypothetical protein
MFLFVRIGNKYFHFVSTSLAVSLHCCCTLADICNKTLFLLLKE